MNIYDKNQWEPLKAEYKRTNHYLKKYGTNRERQASFIMSDKGITIYGNNLLPGYGESVINMNELKLFLVCLWGECRGEPEEGIQHVAQTIINRQLDENKRWGTNISEVILQPMQFSFFNDPIFNLREQIEKDMLGWYKVFNFGVPIWIKPSTDIPCNMYNYFNPKIASPKWAKNLQYYRDIGNHRFFTEGKPDFIV